MARSLTSQNIPNNSFAKATIIVLLCFFPFYSCETYHRKPLDKAAISEHLKTPDTEALRIQASRIRHPMLKPVEIDFSRGLSPDEAAVIAVIASPALRAARDQKGISEAQLLQAGILPNPKFTYEFAVPTGGSTEGTVNSYGLALEWEFTALFTRTAKVDAARAEAASVDLDVAWKEWQVAESARQHIYRLYYIKKQLSIAVDEEKRLEENLAAVKKAFSLRDMTITDQEAAETALQKAHIQVLDISQKKEQERLALNSVLGFPPESPVPIREELEPSSAKALPMLDDIMDGLEERRLDLLALKMGYESQEANLRAAILAQFPAITFGATHARDTTNVITTGFTVSINLPFFDRNQGQIAIQKATRQQLFDEYMNRIFEARSNAATILAGMRSVENEISSGEESIGTARELLRNSRNGFLEGNIDALSYYNEVEKFLTRQLDVLKLRQDLADLYIALELAAGRYLSGPAKKTESKE